jgi:hypothetical protein
MWKRLRSALFVAVAACTVASCGAARNQAAAPVPEADQAVSAGIKDLYMAVSAAPPRSAEQQKAVLRMAAKAANGKELFLVMRAASGVFPAGGDTQLSAIVAGKMMSVATLGQLIEYATTYPVNPESARPLAERMFQLGANESDARVWYRIRVAAYHLKLEDFERQAQARGDELARK